MASDGAASRRPPLAPPPKRRAAGDLLQTDLLTYKRRRRATSTKPSGGSAVASGPDQNQTGMVPHASNCQQGPNRTLARHWRSWRATLEGLLQSPAVSQGSGGIQSCIRDALSHNSCQENGSLGEGQGREDPSGAVHAKKNNGALVTKDATANNGALVKSEDGTAASLEANKAICHNALFDILVSEKFALFCDLLAANFHVSKPDEDVIGLQKIDAKMKNGDYAQNPALLDHDIKQIKMFGRGCLDAGRCPPRHARARHATAPWVWRAIRSPQGVAGGTVPWRTVAAIQTAPYSFRPVLIVVGEKMPVPMQELKDTDTPILSAACPLYVPCVCGCKNF